MAKGTVKTWNGHIAKIASDNHDQLILAEETEFNIGFEPSIGDQLNFKVKKRKQNGEVVLYAKKITFMDANPNRLSVEELKRSKDKQALNKTITAIVLILIVIGLAYFCYQYYQNHVTEKDFIKLSEQEILRDN